MVRVYLASPLFLPEQLDLIKEIESLIESKEGRVALSPKRDGYFVKDIANPQERKKGFDWNTDALKQCDFVVAVLDWLGSYLYATSDKLDEVPGPITIESNLIKDGEGKVRGARINKPDEGTVYECGFAHALGKPVIGFCPQSSRMNLMLSESVMFTDNINDLSSAIDDVTENLGKSSMKDVKEKYYFQGRII